MRMGNVFDLPVSGKDMSDMMVHQEIAAAHAINCHDELVEALEAMVVEGQNVYVALAQMGWGAEAFRKAAEKAVVILNKAKGTN